MLVNKRFAINVDDAPIDLNQGAVGCQFLAVGSTLGRVIFTTRGALASITSEAGAMVSNCVFMGCRDGAAVEVEL